MLKKISSIMNRYSSTLGQRIMVVGAIACAFNLLVALAFFVTTGEFSAGGAYSAALVVVIGFQLHLLEKLRKQSDYPHGMIVPGIDPALSLHRRSLTVDCLPSPLPSHTERRRLSDNTISHSQAGKPY